MINWQAFNWIDYSIIAVVVLSAMISLFRGFIREAISLASWGLGFWLASRYANLIQDYFTRWISAEYFRYIVAFASIFLFVILVGMLINAILGFWVGKSGLSWGNRLLGIVFGAMRGVAVAVLALLLMINMGNLKEIPAVQESQLVARLTPVVLWVAGFLPEHVKSWLIEPSLYHQDKQLR